MQRNIIAILRGVMPEEVNAIAQVIIEAGITQIEVPLNSPQPLNSIEKLAHRFGETALIGAGTVLSVEDVNKVRDAGGRIVVSPDCCTEVIRATKAAGMLSWPGVLTPTECFAALRAGADGLKVFPASVIGPGGIQAFRAVLPKDTQIFAVGGTGADNIESWHKAGVNGFGIGSGIYRAGDDMAAVREKAQSFVAAYDRVYGV